VVASYVGIVSNANKDRSRRKQQTRRNQSAANGERAADEDGDEREIGHDKFMAALAGILHYEIAAERAERNCTGPGTFIPAFLDQLYALGQEVALDVEKGKSSGESDTGMGVLEGQVKVEWM
jgi:hypothetical protein